MAYRVLHAYRAPRSHREITLSQEPPGFESIWLDTDDPAERRDKLAQADFVVAVRMTAEWHARRALQPRRDGARQAPAAP